MSFYRPGQICPISGLYRVVDQYGRRMGYQVTSVCGEPFPPTQNGGWGYVLDNPANHK
jgi:hypothetical protein